MVQLRIKSTEEEVETLKEQLAYYKGQADAHYIQELGKVVNSVGEVGKKQTAQIDKLCELIIEGVRFPSSYLFFFFFFLPSENWNTTYVFYILIKRKDFDTHTYTIVDLVSMLYCIKGYNFWQFTSLLLLLQKSQLDKFLFFIFTPYLHFYRILSLLLLSIL